MPPTEQQIDQFFNDIDRQLKVALTEAPTVDHKVAVLIPVVRRLANALRDTLHGRFDPSKYLPR